MAIRLSAEKAAQITSSASELNGQRSASSQAGAPEAAGATSIAGMSIAAVPALGDELISLTPHGLDQLEAELGTDPPHAHVHHVGAGIEFIAPDHSEQPALGHRAADVLGELAQQQELKTGERHRPLPDVRDQPRDVEGDVAGLDDFTMRVTGGLRRH